MKALVRADASVEIGMGHRTRCQALIQAFTALGWHCQYVVDRRYQAFGSSDDCFIETEAQFWQLAEQVDLVILDHYDYNADNIATLYQHQPNLLVLDDMNDRGEFPAKWLLNPLQQNYSKLVEFPLTGSQYALLRPVFQYSNRSASSVSNHSNTPDKLLVTLGGTDPLALTLPILNALVAFGFATECLQVLLGANAKQAEQVLSFCAQNSIAVEQGLSDVTPLMRQAKMAISAAGGTLFELACIGVPTVFAQVADNQTRSLEEHVPLGWCRTVRFDNVSETLYSQRIGQLVEEVNRLWRDPEWQQTARNTARGLVDGAGAERVAQIIQAYLKA